MLKYPSRTIQYCLHNIWFIQGWAIILDCFEMKQNVFKFKLTNKVLFYFRDELRIRAQFLKDQFCSATLPYSTWDIWLCFFTFVLQNYNTQKMKNITCSIKSSWSQYSLLVDIFSFQIVRISHLCFIFQLIGLS